MKAIHRVGRKAVASFLLVLFASLQVLPQGFADSIPISQELQNQVPQVSVPQAVSSEPAQVLETSIDFLVGGESALSPSGSVVGPIVLPEVPRDIPPVSLPEPELPPSEVPGEPVNPELLNPDWMTEPEVDPVTIEEIPQPNLELTPAPEPLEWNQPFSGNAVISSEETVQVETKEPEVSSRESLIQPKGFFGLIFKLPPIAVALAKLNLIDRFHLRDEEKQQVYNDIKVVSVEKKSWGSPCSIWGEPLFPIACIQMVVSGYQVVLELYGNTYEFRRGELDPAKVFAISAINHLMEHGTPRHPFSRHLVFPELSQIKIEHLEPEHRYERLYLVDLKVNLNRRRTITWRYTVDYANQPMVLDRTILLPKPLAAVERAKKDLVGRFNLTDEEKDKVLKDIKIVSVEEKSWPNPCPPMLLCAAVMVTGYDVVLELYGNTYEFHARGGLDSAKAAAISAINHLMEHGTPKVPWSHHVVHPKLSQIKIGDITKFQSILQGVNLGGLWPSTFYEIDLKVQLNRRRSVTWRYTVDAKTNEVIGRKLYSPFVRMPLPPNARQAVEQAKKDLISRFALSQEEAKQALKDIKLVSIRQETGPRPCPPGLVYAFSWITSYEVVLGLYGNTYEFHAGKLDPAKEAAILAINRLMEEGTPSDPDSRRTFFPKLSQIKIVDSRNGGHMDPGYLVDLEVKFNSKHSLVWRYQVDLSRKWVDPIRKIIVPVDFHLWEPHRFKRILNKDFIVERPKIKRDDLGKEFMFGYSPEGDLLWVREEGEKQKIYNPEGRVIRLPQPNRFENPWPPREMMFERFKDTEDRSVIHFEQRTVPAEP